MAEVHPFPRRAGSGIDLLMSLGIDLDAYAAWLASWGAAPTTISARVSIVRATEARLGWATVTTEELTAWLADPAYSSWTRATYYGHARSVCEWLRLTGQRADDPTRDLRRPHPPKGRPRPLSAAEVSLVLATATGDLRAWLLLGLLAGLRAHEMAKVRGEDVSAEALYVVGKGAKAAMLPTHPALWTLAQSYPRSGWWFASARSSSGHVHPKTVSIAVTRLFAALGIPGSSHRCRHTYGTNLLRAGANIRVVQELMRHDSLASTQIYTEVADDERRAAVLGLAA